MARASGPGLSPFRGSLPLATRRYRPVLAAMADFVSLPAWEHPTNVWLGAIWLEALVLTESGGDPKAVRYEPHQDVPGRRDSASDGDKPGQDDGLLEDDKSYGLLQVMGSNIRRLCGVGPGVPMQFGFALLPLTNLALGLRVLLEDLETVEGDIPRALARYNGGPTGTSLVPGPGGALVYRRQEYVDKVAKNAVLVFQDRY